MIQANELRVSNYIIVENDIHKIVSIDENKIGTKRYDQISDFPIYRNYLDAKWIELIPLTEEIIKSNFKKHADFDEIFVFGDYTIYYIEYCPIENYFNVRVKFDNENSSYLISIKYLHQLQNLYFALTQNELQINFN